MIKTIKGIERGLNKKYNKYFSPYRKYVVISYPKSGRTWLRVILYKLRIELNYQHDETGLVKQASYNSLTSNKEKYKDKKIIFLVRDPRDTVVSAFFQMKKRHGEYQGTISDFIRDEKYGIRKILYFHEIWDQNRHIPKDFLLIRYEDMHDQPAETVENVIRFLGNKKISKEKIQQAVEFAKFENMRKMEQTGALTGRFKGKVLRPTDAKDEETYKTRKGKVNGFYEYFSDYDLNYCNKMMKAMQNPFYPVETPA